MKIYKITEASEYLGVSINTLKTLANNGKINSAQTKAREKVENLTIKGDVSGHPLAVNMPINILPSLQTK